MEDLLRIVELSSGGRPIEVLDLNDESELYVQLESLEVTPAGKAPLLSSGDGRYAGSYPVGERQDNALVSWIAGVKGSTYDAALAAADDLASKCNDAVTGRLIERRRQGASYPTYYSLRGPGSFASKERSRFFDQQKLLPVEIAFPVAPLAHGPRMDIFDPFDVDSVAADFTFSQGTAAQLTWNSAGYYLPTSTARKTAVHSARGYDYENNWVTLEIRPNTASAAQQALVTLAQLDANNYLRMGLGGGTAGVLAIAKVDAGVASDLASNFPTTTTPPSGASFFVRAMKEGNVITVEYWTSEPTPMGAPTTTLSHTLAGANATKFGSGVSGDSGWDWTPVTTSDRFESFRVEPYSRRNVTFPETVQLGGSVPGGAPALADVELTPSGGSAAPVAAVLGWSKRPRTPLSGAVVPFGVLEAESAGDLAGWASVANADSRGGNRLSDTSPTSAETYTASWTIDPSTLDPDDFGDEIALTVFCRALLTSSLVTSKLTLSARPFAGTNFGAERFTEWGSAGKLLTLPSSGTVRRPVKLGTLRLPADRKHPAKWKLWLAGSLGPGSGGANWGLDYLFIVPARACAYSPTGEPNDSTYPKFVRSTNQTRKLITSDLRGFAASPPDELVPDVGLGGSEIELPSGQVDVAVLLSSLAVDDPTSDATDQQTSHAASFHAAVTPRFPLARGV